MRTTALGLVALLMALPASPEDRWEHSGDDANYTNNELEPGVVQPAHDLEAGMRETEHWLRSEGLL